MIKRILAAIILLWSKATLAFHSGIVLTLVAAAIVTVVVITTFSNVNNTGLPNNGFVGVNLWTGDSNNTRIYEDFSRLTRGPQAPSRTMTITAASSGATSVSATGSGTFPVSYIDGGTLNYVSGGTGPATITVTSGQIQGGSANTLTVSALSAAITGTATYSITASAYNTPGIPGTDSGSGYRFLAPITGATGWPTETFILELGNGTDAYSSRLYSCGFIGHVASLSISGGGGSLPSTSATLTGGTVSGTTLTFTSNSGTVQLGQAVYNGSAYIGHITAGSGLSWTITNAGSYSGSVASTSSALQNITYGGQDYSTFTYQAGSAANTDILTFTTPSALFKNVQMVRPDDGLAYGTTQIYSTRYATELAKYAWHRFMQWEQIFNSSNTPMTLQTTWTTRPYANSGWSYSGSPANPFSNGNEAGTTVSDPNGIQNFPYSWESIIQHANTLNRTPWINIPPLVVPSYLSSLGTLLTNNLTTPVMVEYGNENWNNIFNTYSQVYAKYKSFLGAMNNAAYTGQTNYISSATYAATTLTIVFHADIGLANGTVTQAVSWAGFGTGAQYQGTVLSGGLTATYNNTTFTLIISGGSGWTTGAVTLSVTTWFYLNPVYNGVNAAIVENYTGITNPIYAFTTGSNQYLDNLIYTSFMLRLSYDAFANAYATKTPSAVTTGSTITGCPGACTLNVGTLVSGTIAQNQIMTGPLGSVWTAKITGGSGSTWTLSNGVNTTSSQPITTTTSTVMANIKPVLAWQIPSAAVNIEAGLIFMSMNSAAWNTPGFWVSDLAVAPYLTPKSGQATTSAIINSMINDTTSNSLNAVSTTSDMTEVVTMAALIGAHSITYEGGVAVSYGSAQGYSNAQLQACMTYTASGNQATTPVLTNFDLGNGSAYQWNQLAADGVDGQTHFSFLGLTYATSGATNFQSFDDIWDASGSTFNAANVPQYNGMLTGLAATYPSIIPGRYNGVISIDPTVVNASGAMDYGLDLQWLYYLNGGSNEINVNQTYYYLIFKQLGSGTTLNLPFVAYLTAGTTPTIKYSLNYGGSSASFNVYLRPINGTDSLVSGSPFSAVQTGSSPYSLTNSSLFTGYINSSNQLVMSTTSTIAPATGDILSYGGIQVATPIFVGSYVSGGTGANTVGAIYSLTGTAASAVGSSGSPVKIRTVTPSKLISVSLGTIPTTGKYVVTLKNSSTTDTANIGLDLITIY